MDHDIHLPTIEAIEAIVDVALSAAAGHFSFLSPTHPPRLAVTS